MAVEYELKFQATEEILNRIDRAYTQQSVEISMETTYYDTPSGALSDRWYTLRRRLENGISVCTLKAPAKQGRGEWETESPTVEQAVDMLLALGCPKVLPVLMAEGVVPVCGAKFTRRAQTVALPGGTVELALDKGILFGGGREEPLCEVEVELKAGTVQLCDAFANALAEEFQLTPLKSSKFRRALALYKGE